MCGLRVQAVCQVQVFAPSLPGGNGKVEVGYVGRGWSPRGWGASVAGGILICLIPVLEARNQAEKER